MSSCPRALPFDNVKKMALGIVVSQLRVSATLFPSYITAKTVLRGFSGSFDVRWQTLSPGLGNF